MFIQNVMESAEIKQGNRINLDFSDGRDDSRVVNGGEEDEKEGIKKKVGSIFRSALKNAKKS